MRTVSSPVPDQPINCVILVEAGDRADEVMALALAQGAVTTDEDETLCFWIVFAKRPDVLEVFTAEDLRGSMQE